MNRVCFSTFNSRIQIQSNIVGLGLAMLVTDLSSYCVTGKGVAPLIFSFDERACLVLFVLSHILKPSTFNYVDI